MSPGYTDRVIKRWPFLSLVCVLSACDCGSAPAVPGVQFDAGATDSGSDAGVTPVTRVLINEVVLWAVNDWGHSDGLLEPFDGVAGSGAISSGDQWIELKNFDEAVVDLTGWAIEISDASDDTIVLGATDAVLRFSEGSSLESFQPGGLVLIGDPEGHISTDAFFVLRSSDGRIADDVEVGGTVASRDREGDGVGDGVPSADYNGFSRGTFEEAVSRIAGAEDTDVDQIDFVRMRATPLAENDPPVFPEEATPPTLVSATEGVNIAVNGEIRLTFSEPVDVVCADPAIRLLAGETVIPLEPHTYKYQDTQVVLNPIGILPFDTELTIEVDGGDDGVCDLVGNALVGDEVAVFRTEPMPVTSGSMQLTELCIDPLQDWSGSDGVGTFVGEPGDGAVNSDDEWIELANIGASVVDVRTYRVEIYNGFGITVRARSETLMSSTVSTIRVFGTGELDALVPGDHVVVGDPFGAIRPDVVVLLRDGNGALIDWVEVGGNSPEADRGGDGIRNGAPGAGLSGRAVDLDSEVVARVAQTGNEAVDWSHGAATFGMQNTL